MTLTEYRESFGVSFAFIARACGVSSNAIGQVSSGKLKPSFDLAVKIENATQGRVARDNWYPPRRADVSITIGASL